MAGLKGSIKSNRLSTNLSTKKVSVSIGGNGGTVTVTDHAQLTHLDFTENEHTGCAGEVTGTLNYFSGWTV